MSSVNRKNGSKFFFKKNFEMQKCQTLLSNYQIGIPKFLDLKEMFTSIIIPASSCFLDIITPIFTQHYYICLSFFREVYFCIVLVSKYEKHSENIDESFNKFFWKQRNEFKYLFAMKPKILYSLTENNNLVGIGMNLNFA